MMRAVWNGVVLAEAPRTVRMEGNDYFPPESLNREHFSDSRTRTLCPWKGMASYYNVTADGEINPNAAWYYSRPSPLARSIKGHVAFWNGVQIVGESEKPTGRGGRRWFARFRKDANSSITPIPMWRIGVTGGLVGIACCVGPTVLALVGIVSGATALSWATDLYDNYAWWFRLGGLATLGGLLWWSLRRRDQCSIDGVRKLKWRLLTVLAIAVGTYVALYGLTTWLGTLA